jgi:hypothetical protein
MLIGEEIQIKCIQNTVNKIIEKASQILRKRWSSMYKRFLGYPTDKTRRTTQHHNIDKTLSVHSKERILKTARENHQVTL